MRESDSRKLRFDQLLVSLELWWPSAAPELQGSRDGMLNQAGVSVQLADSARPRLLSTIICFRCAEARLGSPSPHSSPGETRV